MYCEDPVLQMTTSFFIYFQAAQAVLIALFNLNTPEFSTMLSVLPKTFQVR